MPVAPNGTAYDLTGPDGASVVVLIHGIGMNRGVTWSAIAPVLARRFRLLSYDLVGHGGTALPDQQPNLTRLSEQLLGLMDHLGIARAALVGFSLGGMINRRVAMDHPDRVTALAILNSPHERTLSDQQRVEEQAATSATSGPEATIEATLARWFTAEFRASDPAAVAQVRDIVLANDLANFAHHRMVLAAGVKELIRPEPAISQPTLVMTGENDSGSSPAMSHAIASEINGARTVIVPALQHLGLIEQPQLFADTLLTFASQTAAPSLAGSEQ